MDKSIIYSYTDSLYIHKSNIYCYKQFTLYVDKSIINCYIDSLYIILISIAIYSTHSIWINLLLNII